MSLRSFWENYKRCRRQKKSGLGFPVYTKLHGVKNADFQGALAQSRAQDKLQLVHVPLPEYPHNTYAYSITLNRVLGYLDKDLSEKLVFVFGAGFCLDGELDEIVGGPPMQYWGARLLVFDDNVFMENCELSHLYE